MIIGKGLYIKKYNLAFKNLPSSFHKTKIAFISDLHGEIYGKKNADLIALIEKERPDFIFIGGDMVVGGVDRKGKARKVSKPSMEVSLDLLEKLGKKFPLYHALGNHEEKLEKTLFKEYNEGLTKLGISLLDNEEVSIFSKQGEKISLYGLTLDKTYYPKLKRRSLKGKEVEEKIGKKDGFSILLAHSPLYFKAYHEWGADLSLSGHFHGGIMRLPLIGGILGPDFLPFPRYSGGLFSKNEKKMIVSCGLGTHTVDLRVFNPPELTVIELQAGESKHGN